MDEQALAEIDRKLSYISSQQIKSASFQGETYGPLYDDMHALVVEVRRLRAMEARYRAHLAHIVGRWVDAEGTTRANDWGLPWAMADDAETVLAETVDHPCSTCA